MPVPVVPWGDSEPELIESNTDPSDRTSIVFIARLSNSSSAPPPTINEPIRFAAGLTVISLLNAISETSSPSLKCRSRVEFTSSFTRFSS
jgi:hypothetical protein